MRKLSSVLANLNTSGEKPFRSKEIDNFFPKQQMENPGKFMSIEMIRLRN